MIIKTHKMVDGKKLGYRYFSARAILEKNSVYDILGEDKKQALIEFFKSKKNYKTIEIYTKK